MSSHPAPLLVRMKDLKQWQGTLDNKLKNKSQNVNASDYESIDGLSSYLDDTNSISNLSSPEKSIWEGKANKPFEQLLEEKLAELENENHHVKTPKLKMPYLKKGSGLSRFRLKPEVKIVRRKKRKESAKPKIQLVSIEERNSQQELLEITPLKAPDIIIKPKSKGTWTNIVKSMDKGDAYTEENPFNTEVIDKINEFTSKRMSPKNSVKTQSIPTPERHSHGEQTLYERTLDDELKLFEALEERALNSSFCSTNSSILKMLSSTPTHKLSPKKALKDKSEVKDAEKCYNLHQKLHQVCHKTEFLNNFMSKLRKGKKRSHLTDNTITNSPLPFIDVEKWSDYTRSHTNSEGSSECETTNLADYVDVGVGTSFSDIAETTQTDLVYKCRNCEMTEYTIKQHPVEIRMREDKIAELEKQNDMLTKEMIKLKKTHQEAIDKLSENLESQKMKYSREKMVFDTYIKDNYDRPSKKEREEVWSLRKELADVQELLKLKETKNGASQARLRTHIKHLEKETSELKGEVAKLTKEKAKLAASQKLAIRRPSDTKMLHEINKNISKLAEETLKKPNYCGDVKEAEYDNQAKHVTVVYDAKTNGLQGFPKTCLKRSCSKYSEDVDGCQSKENTTMDETQFANLSIEKKYENYFGQFQNPGINNSLNDSRKGKTEVLLDDGTKEIRYTNGNVKTISPDGNFINITFYNGDIKQINLRENLLKYYYNATNIWYTQFPDGTELTEFDTGQTERKFKDGRCEVLYPDGVMHIIMPDGREEATYPDGSILIVSAQGDRTLHLPNGQKEIHTRDQKRREYPDGTVKILYPDGTQETRYANGRIRMKDANGILIMDTENFN